MNSMSRSTPKGRLLPEGRKNHLIKRGQSRARSRSAERENGRTKSNPKESGRPPPAKHNGEGTLAEAGTRDFGRQDRSPTRENGFLVIKIASRRRKSESWSSRSVPDSENQDFGRQNRSPTRKNGFLAIEIGIPKPRRAFLVIEIGRYDKNFQTLKN